MQIGTWKGVEFIETDELYEICCAECGDGECQLAVGNGGICPLEGVEMIERTVHWKPDGGGWWQQGRLVEIVDSDRVGWVVIGEGRFIRIPMEDLRDGVIPAGRTDWDEVYRRLGVS